MLVLGLAGCKREVSFEPYRAEFVYTTLAYRPTQATAVGFHRWGGDVLDEKLDDWGEGNLDQLRDFYRKHRKAIEGIPRELMTAEDRADCDLVLNRIALGEFELNRAKQYKYDPRIYVDGVRDGLVSLYAGEHAPKKLRYFDMVRRMEWLPKYLVIAKKNLVAAPLSWNVEAQERTVELIRFIEGTLREDCAPELRPKFSEEAPKAVKELEAFRVWLDTELKLTQREWRMEPEIYAAKLKLELGMSMEEARQAVEADIAKWKTAKAGESEGGELKTELKLMEAPEVLRVEGARLYPGAVLHPEQKSRVWVRKGGAPDGRAMARVVLQERAMAEARKSEPRSRKVLRTVFEPAWRWERWPEGSEAQLLKEAELLRAQIELVGLAKGAIEDAALMKKVELMGGEIPAGYVGWLRENAKAGKR